MDTILFALWFFLPGGIANAAPILAAKAPVLSRWNTPMDFGAHYGDKRVLGDHKTWRGMAAGILAAVITVSIQQYVYQNTDLDFLARSWSQYLQYSPLLLGTLFGFGALAGDAVESFIKRRVNVPPGQVWFPFDQTDYIIGGCLATLAVVQLPLLVYCNVILFWFIIHLGASYVGYLLKLKTSPI